MVAVRKYFYIITLVFLLVFSASSKASDYSIVAVINDHIISNLDLTNRLQLAISTTGLEDTTAIRQKLLPQVLQIMINEALQKQEAEKIKITFSENDMSAAIGNIERKNKLPEGGFPDFVKNLNVSTNTVIEQIRAQILWQRVVMRKIAPQVHVSIAEVKEVIEVQKLSKDNPEASISIIHLPLREISRDIEVRDLANNLVSNIRQGGDFASLARQFSENPSASEGGKMGWVKVNEVNKILRSAILALKNGEVSSPVKTDNGYMIVKLHDSRNKKATTAQMAEEEIRKMLRAKKIDLEARRYMKKLRESAYIEVRI